MDETPARDGSHLTDTPATDKGTTRPAGEGVDAGELSSEVAGQTASDLKVEGEYERDAD